MRVRKIEEIEKDKLEAKLEDSIFLRVIDFGLGYPDGFAYQKLIDSLKLEGWEKKIVDEYMEAAYKNAYTSRITGVRGVVETPFFIVHQGATSGFMHEDHKYIISFDAHFKFIDYHELKFARENAREARTLSQRAILLSMGAIIVSILIPIAVAQFLAQTVKLDEVQFQSIQKIEDAATTRKDE